MDAFDVAYRINTATAKEIAIHLHESNVKFDPPLAQRVNIAEYSRKLFKKAVTFEAWGAGVLVGLVAIYFSNNSDRSAYITDVSVSEAFLRLGIASRLLVECIEYAKKEGVREISLEVGVNNHGAVALYTKFNFLSDGIDNGFLKMKLTVYST